MLVQPFSVIPVMDLKQGQVVHAMRGQRHTYQPIRSQLCNSSDPMMMAQALLSLHPFRQVYVADLDAIGQQGTHRPLIEALADKFADIEWWVDDGSVTPWKDKPHNIHQVLGTESYPQLEAFATEEFVLSLDTRDGMPLGNAHLHKPSSLWPRRIIIMSLAQVGSKSGIDSSLIRQYAAHHSTHHWYVAGGVRHRQDLLEAKHMGAQGALVATALHNGQLTAQDLSSIEAA